jgi:cytochrome P450
MSSSIDLFAPQTQENWYPAYDELRENVPVYLVPGTSMYVLTRYEDVAFVSKRTDLFANGPAPSGALLQEPEALRIYREKGRIRRAPLSVDPPMHRRYRSLVDPFFTMKAAEMQRSMIEGMINSLIDNWIDRPTGELEFVRDFALPLPVFVITALLGFPLSDVEQLKVWSEAWVMPFAGRLTSEQQIYVAEQGVAFQNYIVDVINDKRRSPDDSVISHLAHATLEDSDGTSRPLTEEEIIFTTDHLYIGGNETTTFALTSGMWLLLQNDGMQDRLRNEPVKIPQFVEEVLRLESPTQGLYRHTLTDVVIGGVEIPKGSTVHMRFGAANRDQRMFTSPAALDLDRSNSGRHVAFGVGEHHCPGAGLSRFEQVVAFEALLQRVSHFSLHKENDFKHKPGFVLRALEALHLEFS